MNVTPAIHQHHGNHDASLAIQSSHTVSTCWVGVSYVESCPMMPPGDSTSCSSVEGGGGGNYTGGLLLNAANNTWGKW